MFEVDNHCFFNFVGYAIVLLCVCGNWERVFYNPDEPGEITFLGQIWLYKAVGFWVVACCMLGIPLVGTIFYWEFDICDCDKNEMGMSIARFLCGIVCAFGLFVIGSTFAILICEIIGFSPFAWYFFLAAHSRYISAGKSFWAKKAFDFILDNKSLHMPIPDEENNNSETITVSSSSNIDDFTEEYSNSVSKIKNRIIFSKQERLFRVIYVNYCFMHHFNYGSDVSLMKYLQSDENINTEWSNVTLSQLREKSESKTWGTLWDEIKYPFIEIPKSLKSNWNNADYWYGKLFWGFGIIWGYCLLYLLFPLFVISRLFSIFFPLISIIYYNFDIKSIELLQWILTILYGIFICSWIIAAIRCIHFYHWTLHLFPGGTYWWVHTHSKIAERNGVGFQYKRLNLMQLYYNKRLNDKYMFDEREQVVIEILGRDIGGLIVSFWPKFEFKEWLDQFEQDKKRLKLEGTKKRGLI